VNTIFQKKIGDNAKCRTQKKKKLDLFFFATYSYTGNLTLLSGALGELAPPLVLC